tara:strand:- start:226 stop:573 length:348 start_codon:yes stop_codon:yes gene_type:complete
MNKLVMSLLLIIIANIGTWFQFQGHYWLDKPFLKSLTFVMLSGAILSPLFWYATKFSYEHFGQFWNIRLMGFGAGTIVFGIITWALMNEAPTLKTIICIMLALCIVLIQVTNVIK